MTAASLPTRPKARPARTAGWIGATVAGMCALLVGVGLGRFAYSPLIPAMVTEGWFDSSAAAYLGAANLAGYLAGAVAARRMPVSVGILRGMMVLTAVSFVACAWPLPYAWFFLWRFAAGFTGAVIMVLAAPHIISAVSAHRAGLVGGIVFAGVGLGIAASGSLVPALVDLNLTAAWLGICAACLVCTAISWRLWPVEQDGVPEPRRGHAESRSLQLPRSIWFLVISYGLIAAALVPHMVFLVDYIARGLGRGLAAGGLYWMAFGAAAVVGPVVAGKVADRVGFGRAMQVGLALLTGLLAWLALTESEAALIATTLFVGAGVPGFTALALGRFRSLMRAKALEQATRLAWARGTLAFAVFQAAAGYGCSLLYDVSGDHRDLFTFAAIAAALALAVDLLSRSARGEARE